MKPLQTQREHNIPPAKNPPREGIMCARHGSPGFCRAALLVLLASFSSLSCGEPIGRLFFTPDERASLDRDRLTGGNMEQEPQRQESLTLNGIVKRSSGKTTVWVNHTVQNESDFPPGTKSQARKTQFADFPVTVPKTGKAVTLKVGQTLNVDSGEIREGYQSPAVTPQPDAEHNAAQASGTTKINNG